MLRKAVFKEKGIVFQRPETKSEMPVGIDPALIESERARPGETSITKPREGIDAAFVIEKREVNPKTRYLKR